MIRYNVFFVPEFRDRKKISKIRAKACNLTHSTQALQYPVHMSLISGSFETNNFAQLEKELRIYCKKQKPVILKAEKNITALPNRFWAGISIYRTKQILVMQKELQYIINKFVNKKEKHSFHPLHITCTFPAKIEDFPKIKNPITSLKFNKITIVRRLDKRAKYRIYKTIKFS